MECHLLASICLLPISASERTNHQAERDSRPNAYSQLMRCNSDSGTDADANGQPDSNLHLFSPSAVSEAGFI